jgi:ABC-type nitrate/sulfonate/bicarbonate transport system substrate-binding protein
LKRELRTKAVIFLLAVVSVAARAEAQDLKVIKIGYPAISYNQVHIWVAKDAGLFKRHGLDAEAIFFRGGQMVTQAFESAPAIGSRRFLQRNGEAVSVGGSRFRLS